MSMQGTWVHNIIQVVADAMNLRVHIIESNKKFSDMTLVEPSNMIYEAWQSIEKLFFCDNVVLFWVTYKEYKELLYGLCL